MVGNYSKWSWRPAEQKMKLFTASSFGEHPRPGGGSKGCGRGRDTLTGSKRKRVVERGGVDRRRTAATLEPFIVLSGCVMEALIPHTPSWSNTNNYGPFSPKLVPYFG